MKALIFKIGAFLVLLFSFWKWGQTSAKLKEAEKKANEAIKESKRISENNAMPYVDDPALCLYDVSEDDISEDEKEISNKT